MDRKQTHGKTWAGILLCLVLGAFSKASAVGPNPDTMIVSVTPGNTGFGVVISSVNANGYEFGPVNLGQTTASTAPILVESSGTVSEFFSMSVVSDGGLDAWTPLTADGTPGHNEFELLGRFTALQPQDSAFDGTDDIITGSAPLPAGSKFNQAGVKTNPGATKNLWLKLKMPATVSSPGQRLLTLSINGQGS